MLQESVDESYGEVSACEMVIFAAPCWLQQFDLRVITDERLEGVAKFGGVVTKIANRACEDGAGCAKEQFCGAIECSGSGCGGILGECLECCADAEGIVSEEGAVDEDHLIEGKRGVQFCGTSRDGWCGLEGVQGGRNHRVCGVGLMAKLISDGHS